jgi:hypothetical protein
VYNQKRHALGGKVMTISAHILADLQAVLSEGHHDFSFLSLYKGVPLVCRARLTHVTDHEARFVVQPPESAALKEKKTTLVLSDGLLEPLEAKVSCLDLANGEFVLRDFAYAGSKFANRRELRVQPAGGEKVKIASDGRVLVGHIADLSVRGLGIRLPIQEVSADFSQGKLVAVTLELPEGSVSMEGKIRSLMRDPDNLRLAIEFTGAVPEKATIIRYVMQRRSEIMAEVRELFIKAVQQD